jgi:hypothetical protein
VHDLLSYVLALTLRNLCDLLLLCVSIAISAFSFAEVAVVTVWGRRVGWLLVLLINSFFVFFSVLKTSQGTQQWQHQYVMACVAQFIIEVLIFQSINVIWVHWVIPRLIQREVTVVVNSLKSLIATSLANPVDWQQPLDTTDHFFVSKAIARKYPHLLESAIVLSFHSYFPPGRMSNHWGRSRDAVLNRKRDRALSLFLRALSVTMVVIGLLQFVGTLNMNVQNFIMSLVLPIAFVAAYVAAAFIIGHPLYMAFVVGASALLVIRHFMKNAQQDRTGEAADKELLFMPSSVSSGQQRLFDSPGTAEVTAKVPSHLNVRIDMEVKNANRPVPVTNDAVTLRALVSQHSDVSGSVERLGSHESESDDSMALEDVEEDVVEEEEDSEAARSEQEELSSNGSTTSSSSNAEHESSSCSGADSDCSSDECEVAIRVPSMTSLDRDAVVYRRSGPHEQVATSGSASAALRQEEEEEYSIRLERRRASIAVLMARRGRHRPDNSTASRDIVATWQQLVARNEG